MIRDLAQAEGIAKVTAKACIIGGGIAGLLLASRLVEHGVAVVVLESGGEHPTEANHPLNAVKQIGEPYRGAIAGRCRGFGGNSAIWGGQLVPLDPATMAARPHVDLKKWPLGPRDIQSYLSQIERLFGVDGGAYDATFFAARGDRDPLPLADSDIELKASKVANFKKRNLASVLREVFLHNSSIEVWLNATVTEFEVESETGRLRYAFATNREGKRLQVRADCFVVACGAIESTRLLLALDLASNSHAFAGCSALGRYFHDHLSLQMAELIPKDRRRLNRAFAPHFVRNTMRSTRLELSHRAQTEDNVASAYGHVAMETEDSSSFNVLRDFLRNRQKTATVDFQLLLALSRQVPYLTLLAYWRFIYGQLYYPSDAPLRLHVVIEQLPHFENQITLTDERDLLGACVPAINWRPRETEQRTLASYMKRVDGFWRRNSLDRLACLSWIAGQHDLEETIQLPRTMGDIFHPAGTTRMGLNARDAVVDCNMRTFAVANLWVASTSVFPTLGSANPTLTLMMLTLRLGDHLTQIMSVR